VSNGKCSNCGNETNENVCPLCGYNRIREITEKVSKKIMEEINQMVKIYKLTNKEIKEYNKIELENAYLKYILSGVLLSKEAFEIAESLIKENDVLITLSVSRTNPMSPEEKNEYIRNFLKRFVNGEEIKK